MCSALRLHGPETCCRLSLSHTMFLVVSVDSRMDDIGQQQEVGCMRSVDFRWSTARTKDSLHVACDTIDPTVHKNSFVQRHRNSRIFAVTRQLLGHIYSKATSVASILTNVLRTVQSRVQGMSSVFFAFLWGQQPVTLRHLSSRSLSSGMDQHLKRLLGV